jgi:hypothetical protein
MVNLNLKTQGTDTSKAQPAMGTLAKATLTQPPKVVLPAAQETHAR